MMIPLAKLKELLDDRWYVPINNKYQLPFFVFKRLHRRGLTRIERYPTSGKKKFSKRQTYIMWKTRPPIHENWSNDD